MANPNNVGSFVPTTNVWDVGEIYSTDINSPQFKELLVRLYQNINNLSISANGKDAAIYDQSEFVNGQQWFSDPTLNSSTPTSPSMRNVFRKVINFGALPNTGTKNVAHGITLTPTYTFTRIYGGASDTTNLSYLPLPYASPTAGNNIELSVGPVNVTITTGSNRSTYTTTYVVLEYIKS